MALRKLPSRRRVKARFLIGREVPAYLIDERRLNQWLEHHPATFSFNTHTLRRWSR